MLKNSNLHTFNPLLLIHSTILDACKNGLIFTSIAIWCKYGMYSFNISRHRIDVVPSKMKVICIACNQRGQEPWCIQHQKRSFPMDSAQFHTSSSGLKRINNILSPSKIHPPLTSFVLNSLHITSVESLYAPPISVTLRKF